MHMQNLNAPRPHSALIHWLGLPGLLAGCSGLLIAADNPNKGSAPAAGGGFVWPSEIPADCPFPRSPTLTGVYFTGKHSDYRCGDTFYPSWAGDGNLYSPWTDGTTDGVKCYSGDLPKRGAITGHAVMTGDDPLKLEIKNTSPPKEAWAKPYRGRYPCGSLVHNGIWYYGTYCLGPKPTLKHNGFDWNWPNLGPMPGFQISRDLGKTWEASPLSPEKPLFPEPSEHLGPVKMGAPHFVDLGKNMEHSPDGKAYLLGMGAEKSDPHPRPCVKPGQSGVPYVLNPECKEPFAHANLSWISADQVYLARDHQRSEGLRVLCRKRCGRKAGLDRGFFENQTAARVEQPHGLRHRHLCAGPQKIPDVRHRWLADRCQDELLHA